MKNLRDSKFDGSKPFTINIPAGSAAPIPPLGPALGSRNIQIAAFCKDFNGKTKHLKVGYPTPTTISINPDRTWNVLLHPPPADFLIKLAAGIDPYSEAPEEYCRGMITLKHVYEIGLVQSSDSFLRGHTLERICSTVVRTARKIGVQVVPNINPMEYENFLSQQEKDYQSYLSDLQVKRLGLKN